MPQENSQPNQEQNFNLLEEEILDIEPLPLEEEVIDFSPEDVAEMVIEEGEERVQDFKKSDKQEKLRKVSAKNADLLEKKSDKSLGNLKSEVSKTVQSSNGARTLSQTSKFSSNVSPPPIPLEEIKSVPPPMPIETLPSSGSASSKSSRMEKTETKEIKVIDKELKKSLIDNVNLEVLNLQNVFAAEYASQEEKIEQVKKQLTKLMEAMHALTRIIDPTASKNGKVFNTLYKAMDAAVALKVGSDKEVSLAFSEIFHEYNDFIEDELIFRIIQKAKLKGQTIYYDRVFQDFYGRTPEEVEEVKNQNRKSVAQEIEKMAQESFVSVEMLEKLHEINNRGIVPKFVSKMREEAEPKYHVKFGKRIGIFDPEVRLEVEDVIDRANELVVKRAVKTSRRVYEIGVARLHNDLLDIHPFKDRNGSTFLIFIELMMAKEGYKPSEEREKDYYKMLRKALDNNIAAIGVIMYEHFLISNVPGYYKGKTFEEQRKIIYDFTLKKEMQQQKEERQMKKAERKKLKTEEGKRKKNPRAKIKEEI